jgi:hypothetical protein
VLKKIILLKKQSKDFNKMSNLLFVSSRLDEKSNCKPSTNGKISRNFQMFILLTFAVLICCSQSSNALFGNIDYYWVDYGTKPININVCWENPAAATDAWKLARQQAIESSWSRYARINFHQFDTCVFNEAGLHIVICSQSTSTCTAYPSSQGPHGRYGDGLNYGVQLNINHPPSVTIHEIGHALGWYHEEERLDYDGTATGSGNCAKQSWPNPYPQYLGAYDKNSIMAYCNAGSGLTPNDIASVQRVYGRHIQGSIVSPLGYCVAAHYASGFGDTAFLWKCDEANDDQEWLHTKSGGNDNYLALNGIIGKMCLAPVNNQLNDLMKTAVCASNKDWVFEKMYIRGFGGLCMDLQNGNTASGTPIQVWQCGALGGANQRWSLGGDGRLRYGSLSSSYCARIVNNRLVIGSCLSGDVFSYNNGKISLGLSCLDVLGPSDAQYVSGKGLPSNGMVVQLYSCNTALNQKWNLNGQLRFGENHSQCLARDAGKDSNGVVLRLQACNTDMSGQEWDYYF